MHTHTYTPVHVKHAQTSDKYFIDRICNTMTHMYNLLTLSTIQCIYAESKMSI